MKASWNESFAALQPGVFRTYLNRRGWTEGERPRSFLFHKSYGEGKAEVEIPRDSDFVDYQRRIAQAVDVMVIVEDTEPLELLRVLENPSFDVLRFRYTGQTVDDGTIPLEDALRIRQARKQLLLSAAHSVVEPLPHFSRLSRAEPMAFLNSCREAPSRPGSFISEVLVPVEPEVGKLDLEDPFARRTTELLARALQSASSSLERGHSEELLKGARNGLSSNFLKALSEMEPPGERGTLEIGFRWSPERDQPKLESHSISFSTGVFSTVRGAARALRQNAQVTGYEIEGFVTRLRRTGEDTSQPGEIVIAASIEEEPRTSKVHLTLEPDAYQLAVDAHSQASRVAVTGTLVRNRRKLTLKEPSGFRILSSDD